jgi:hypothetical protein
VIGGEYIPTLNYGHEGEGIVCKDSSTAIIRVSGLKIAEDSVTISVFLMVS